MGDLKGTPSGRHVAEAFARLSQARGRFEWFARRAEADGRSEVASLFEDLAAQAAVEAAEALDLLVEVGDPVTGVPFGPTIDNLKSAVDGALEDYTETYPEQAAAARRAGLDDVAAWFDRLADQTRGRATRLRRGLEAVV